jgi:ABC-type Fe3+-siderophore transport system permease subunit
MADAPKDRPPLPLGLMLFHGALAAVLFFCFNRFVLAQPFAASLVFAAVAAPFAAYLAYKQAGR